MNKIETPFGYVEILIDNNEFQVAIVVVDPEKEVPMHYHKKTVETDYLLNGEVEQNGKIRKSGTAVVWKFGEKHNYKNISDNPIRILCVTAPPWTKEDEIPVK